MREKGNRTTGWPVQEMKGDEVWLIPVLFREGAGISVA
jgi:hypothetical protein